MPTEQVLGPFLEGDSLTLDCHVSGGDPLPTVSWHRDQTLVDNSMMKTFDKTIKNRLTLVNLGRRDLGAR